MSATTYDYKAISPGGEARTGVIEAPDQQEAYRKVAALGLTPVKIKARGVRAPLLSWGRINPYDIADLTRELAVLIEARIPLARGLHSISEHETKPAMRDMVREIASAIEGGRPVTEALSRHRDVFGEVYIETVRAAEKSGNLPVVISHLAELLDRQIESRQQLKRALMYPAIVLSVVALAVSVIFIFVVPRFATTFEGQGVKLPLITRIVQAVGNSAATYWWAYLGVVGSAFLGLFIGWRSPSGRPALERATRRIPYIGRMLLADTAARFARVMAIGMSSGLDVIEAIEISGRATGNHSFRAETKDMASRLRGGQQLGDALRSSQAIPEFAKRMLGAGKDSSELARACGIVGKHYDRESSHLMKNINTVIEPLLTVALAAIVLIVALSVFLPMWEMVRLHR